MSRQKTVDDQRDSSPRVKIMSGRLHAGQICRKPIEIRVDGTSLFADRRLCAECLDNPFRQPGLGGHLRCLNLPDLEIQDGPV